jgi:hypothetical protein
VQYYDGSSAVWEKVMRSTWSEPYLWVHLAGIAAVPIFLELCLLGLKAAESALPAALVFLLVAVIGIGPIFWMQWQRPFSIFSLVFLALKPSELTETQRRILRRFKAPLGKVIAVSVAIAALAILWQLNQWVPLVVIKTKIVPGGSLGGLLLAAVAFLLSNLFLQVPASVLPVLLTPDSKLAATDPYPVTDISKDFTLIGLRVKQILPKIVPNLDTKEVAEPAQASISAIASTESVASTPTGLDISSNLSEVSALEPLPTEEMQTEERLADERLPDELADEGQPEELEAPPEPLPDAIPSEVGTEDHQSPENLSPDALPETQPEALQQPEVHNGSAEAIHTETLQAEIAEPAEPEVISSETVSDAPTEISPAEATDSQSNEVNVAADSVPNVTDTIVAIQPSSASEAELPPAEPPPAEPPTVDEAADESIQERSVTDTVVRIEPPTV